MRNREERLRWTENLVRPSYPKEFQRRAFVIPTAIGDVGIEFSAIIEVLPGARVQPFAFLPEDFCGVVLHNSTLVPVVETGGIAGETAHIVITESGRNLLALRFCGTPLVVDLDKIDYIEIEAHRITQLSSDKLPLLNIDEVIKALLDKEAQALF